MKNMKKLMATAMVVAAATSTPALAMDFNPYVGLDYAYGNANYKSQSGVSGDDIFGNDFHGVNPYIGAQVHENVSVELGYLETGRKSKSFDAALLGGAGTATTETKLKGFHIDAVGNIPLTDKFDLLGNIGLARFKADVDIPVGGGATINTSDTDTAWRLGAGGLYSVSESIKIRSMARYNIVDWDDTAKGFWQLSAGLQYRF